MLFRGKKVQDGILNFWSYFDEAKERKRKYFVKRISGIALGAISGIYEKANGRASFKKIFILSLLINSLMVIAWYIISLKLVPESWENFTNNWKEFNFSRKSLSAISLLMLFIIISLINMSWEYISYKFTKYFIIKLNKSGNLLFIFLDFFCLFLVYFLLAFALFEWYSLSNSSAHNIANDFGDILLLIIFFSPISSFAVSMPNQIWKYFVNSPEEYKEFFMVMEESGDWLMFSLPAALSVCIPTMTFVLTSLIFYNTKTFSFMSGLASSLAGVNLSKSKKIWFFISSLMISLITVVSVYS